MSYPGGQQPSQLPYPTVPTRMPAYPAQPGVPPDGNYYPYAPVAQQPGAAYPGYPPVAGYYNPSSPVPPTTAASYNPYPTPSGTEIYAPSVLPDPNFNAQRDCETLRKAMKGAGTDERNLIAVLCRRSWQQRYEIMRNYQQMFGKDLAKEVESETGGNFHRVLERLLKTPSELGAYELRKAMKGVGTDEECLVEVICTKSNDELRAVETAFFQMHGKKLESEISDETSGYFKRILISLLSCARPPEYPPDWNAAAVDARALYEAGQNRTGTDEVRFNAILCSRSYTQLRAIFDCYARDFRTDVCDVIKSEFSGDIQKALLAVIFVIRNRPGYFATRLNKAMTGAGTKDEMLLRIIIMRCDFDLAAIKAEYQRFYGKTLSQAIKDETSGDYKNALLALIGDNY